MRKKYLSALVAALALTVGLPAVSHATSATAQQTQANAQKCTGTVVDSDGEPLYGATVAVVGTTNVAATNIDGEFSLSNVAIGATLRFTYVGCTPQEVKWTGEPLNITMASAGTDLDEVVVVGYGVQKKVNLTGAVSQVKGDELARHPVGDVAQSLQGMIPGLTVSNTNAGRPGGSATIQLRGTGNLSGSGTPYVLVDGVEMSLSDINPSDVESISVLKDAGAAAIYGARAAYGVILVTTKKGQEGSTRVSYQGMVGWNKPTKLPDMLDGYEFAEYWNNACRNSGVARLYSDQKLELLRKFRDDPSSVDPWQELSPNANMNPAFENSESGIGNTNYFDLHYKDWAFKQNHNLSASGGGKKAQYYFSLGYYSEDGILRYADMGYKRYTFASNIRSSITKWLNVRANAKFFHSQTDTPFGDGGLSEGFYHSLARFRPTVHYLDPNGNFTELTMIPYLQSGTYTQTKRDRFSITVGADIQPLKNWFIFADYTYRYMGLNYEALNVAPDIFAADGVTTSKGVRSELGVQTDGKYTRANATTRYQNVNIYTNYIFSLADVHNFTLLAGFQEEKNKYQYMKNYVTGLFTTTTPSLGLGTSELTGTDTRNGWTTRGWYGRINYDYDGKYLLEMNARYDASSRFAKNNRWGFFPSVSAGWNISREKFMESINHIVPVLKLRASWGKLGNQSGAALYTFASTMGITSGKGSFIFPDGRHQYISAPGVIDPNVTWEKVESKNIGVDFGLFNSSLTGSAEIFQRDTKDMLGPGFDFPDFFGASAPQANNASLRNRGWEFQISYHGTIGRDIRYTVGGSVSDATTKITKYANPDGTDPIGNWYVGRRYGEIWGLKTDGLIQTQAEADAYNQNMDLTYLNGGVWTPGDVKYRDINGDGKINKGSNKLGDMGDWSVIGNTEPRYEYTINGSISWKGITLYMMFQGIGKRDWNPGSGADYFWGWSSYAQATLFREHLDYWSEDNPGAYYPKPYLHTAGGIGTYNNRNKQTSDRYLQNAAYIRLKNITLSYDLPKSIISHVGLSKVQVYFTGENLWTHSNMTSIFDPEAIFTSSSYNGGGKNYPFNKTVSFGLVVNL